MVHCGLLKCFNGSYCQWLGPSSLTVPHIPRDPLLSLISDPFPSNKPLPSRFPVGASQNSWISWHHTQSLGLCCGDHLFIYLPPSWQNPACHHYGHASGLNEDRLQSPQARSEEAGLGSPQTHLAASMDPRWIQPQRHSKDSPLGTPALSLCPLSSDWKRVFLSLGLGF